MCACLFSVGSLLYDANTDDEDDDVDDHSVCNRALKRYKLECVAKPSLMAALPLN